MPRYLMAAPRGCAKPTTFKESVVSRITDSLVRNSSPGHYVAEKRFYTGAELVLFVTTCDGTQLRNQHGLSVTATISEACWIEAIHILRSRPITEIYKFLWNLYFLRGSVVIPHTLRAYSNRYTYQMSNFTNRDILDIARVIYGEYGKSKRHKVIYVNNRMIIK